MAIFVSIASYCDPLLSRTVSSCLESASDRTQISIGIVDQSPAPTVFAALGAGPSVRYVHLHQSFGRGPCFARAVAAGLWQGEDFFLQVDSHTLFERNWDERLVAALQAAEHRNPRTIISTYPCAFEVVNDIAVPQRMPGKTIVLRVLPDTHFSGDSPLLRFQGIPLDTVNPVAGFHVGAGCLFSRGFLLQEIPIDPYLYFEGEEQNLAVRAWTAGWDIQHIADMPIYHLYKASPDRSLHWEESDDAARPVRWWTLRDQSELRLRRLLFEGENLGAYGLGRARSLADFATFSGIDYLNRNVDHPHSA